jgi:hypothetical protein
VVREIGDRMAEQVEGREPSLLEVTRQIPRMRDPKARGGTARWQRVPSIEGRGTLMADG